MLGWEARFGVDLNGSDFLGWQRQLGMTSGGNSSVTADNVHVGETSVGSYTLNGGTLTVNNTLSAEFAGLSVGYAADGATFTHSGGTVNHQASHLAVGLFAQGTVCWFLRGREHEIRTSYRHRSYCWPPA